MPLLMLPDIPVHLAGKQVTYLLHASEFVFPPLNAFYTLSYIILASVAYTRSTGSLPSILAASADPYANYAALALAAASHVLPTVYTLTVMSPVNKKMTVLSKQMNELVAESKEKNHILVTMEEEFRKTQKTWQFWSYVRGVIMVGSAVAGIRALVV
jgi:hypothetical protein